MFEHLDTVIAFGAIVLAASLLVTAGTQLLISLLGLRGANLRSSLGDLLENSSPDRDARRYGRVIAHRVLRHPLVSDSAFSRFAIRVDKLPFVPAEAAGKLRWAGSEIPLQPWFLGALSGFFLWPATLAILDRLTSLDLNGFSALVVRYIPFLDLSGHPWRSGIILGTVLGGLMSRWRLATSIRLDEMLSVLEKLSAPPDGTLPDPAQRAMLVIAGERRSRPRPSSKPVSAQVEKMLHDSEEGEGGVALAVSVEKALAQDSSAGQPDPRLLGLSMWFDRVLERASQRLTLQARVITVVLSVLFVFSAHLDAIRLFQALSSGGQSRAQLAASADALIKQSEQLPRGKEGAAAQAGRDGARTSVPDVYRGAMAAVLALPPAPAEQAKPKARGVSHSNAAKTTNSTPSLTNASLAEPGDLQQASVTSVTMEAGSEQATPAVQTAAKERERKTESAARSKSSAKEQERLASAPKEDAATVAAKMKAGKALETRPGFADREDAVLWLRATLGGDPALENLTAAYEQEVNTQLGSDADKLLDHSASIKGELARSQVRLVPQEWTGWTPNQGELPGLLISVVFLSLGAALCYNALKLFASLRPMPAVKPYK